MMNDLFRSIEQGLKEALLFSSQGEGAFSEQVLIHKPKAQVVNAESSASTAVEYSGCSDPDTTT